MTLLASLRNVLTAAAHALSRCRVSPLERYLSDAVDHADLKRRMSAAQLSDGWVR